MVAQFTAKAANSERAIYFCHFMSCSINKLKPNILTFYSHIKIFCFSILREKNCWRPLPPLSLRPCYGVMFTSTSLAPCLFLLGWSEAVIGSVLYKKMFLRRYDTIKNCPRNFFNFS